MNAFSCQSGEILPTWLWIGRRTRTREVLVDIASTCEALRNQVLRRDANPVAEVVVQRELPQGCVDCILDANRNCHQERLGRTWCENLSLDLCRRPKRILLELPEE